MRFFNWSAKMTARQSLLALAIAPTLVSCTTDAAPLRTETSSALSAEYSLNFEAFSKDYLDTVNRLDPVGATQRGDHRFDRQLPDISETGRKSSTAAWDRLLKNLQSIQFENLSRDERVDYRLIENDLRYRIWNQQTLQEWSWNPQLYHNLVSYGLYSLLLRDFAPWPERYEALLARMEQTPAFFANAREQLDPKIVPREYAEIVVAQTPGIISVIEQLAIPDIEKAGGDRTRFDRAFADLRTAVDTHKQWLENELLPLADGDFRLGSELYDQKMQFGLMSSMSRMELKRSAAAALAQTRAEMREIAVGFDECQPSVGLPASATEQTIIECALEKAYQVRPGPDDVVETARAALNEATTFAREQGFIEMPDTPVEVVEVPEFFQGTAVAYLDPPAPMERNLPAFYAISPIPDHWTDKQAESFLREYNTYMLHDVSIHEGIPGHYLHLNMANRNASTVRAILASGPFTEGWAVYAEQLMEESNYLDGDPLFKLIVRKTRLRSIINTLLDIGIHTEGMTKEEAMQLMMEKGFQQESEAAGKWVRATTSSVQLLSYFSGYAEHIALRKEAQKRWGDRFTLRRYHDAVLAHGSPPTRYVRDLMFDLPIR
jgi:uncharacterized protein (DUF885 family)